MAMKSMSKHDMEVNLFIKSLMNFGLSKQQIKTLRGQALAGNLEDARKGLVRLMKKQKTNIISTINKAVKKVNNNNY